MDPASMFFLVPQRPLVVPLMSDPSRKKNSSPRYVPTFPLWFFFSYTKKFLLQTFFSFSFYVFLLLRKRLPSPNDQGWTCGPV